MSKIIASIQHNGTSYEVHKTVTPEGKERYHAARDGKKHPTGKVHDNQGDAAQDMERLASMAGWRKEVKKSEPLHKVQFKAAAAKAKKVKQSMGMPVNRPGLKKSEGSEKSTKEIATPDVHRSYSTAPSHYKVDHHVASHKKDWTEEKKRGWTGTGRELSHTSSFFGAGGVKYHRYHFKNGQTEHVPDSVHQHVANATEKKDHVHCVTISSRQPQSRHTTSGQFFVHGGTLKADAPKTNKKNLKKSEDTGYKPPREDSDLHDVHVRSYKTRNHHVEIKSNKAGSSHEAHVYHRDAKAMGHNEEDVLHVSGPHRTDLDAADAANKWSRENAAPGLKKGEANPREEKARKDTLRIKRGGSDDIKSTSHLPKGHKGPHWTVAYAHEDSIYTHHHPSEKAAVKHASFLSKQGHKPEILTPDQDE
jgi:hypothetical protein